MGRITDHTFENLAPSDLMIACTRPGLLHAARWRRCRSRWLPSVFS